MIVWQQHRDQRIDTKTQRGDQRHDAKGFMYIEMMAEKAEDQINSKLGAEIDQYQRAKQRVGNSVHFPEGRK